MITERIMKKIFFAAALCMLTAISAMAQDKLFIDNFSIEAGKTAKVSVNLTNPENVFTAVQFDLTLPEGLDIALNKKQKLDIVLNNGDDGRLDDQTCSASKASNGAYRFVVSSMTSAEIFDKEGEILSITLQASDTFVNGEGNLDAIVLVKPNGDKLSADKATFSVNDATGINAIDVDGENATRYNLNGQRVAKSYKGVVVKDGKKFFVK